jgi:hypothetical protein
VPRATPSGPIIDGLSLIHNVVWMLTRIVNVTSPNRRAQVVKILRGPASLNPEALVLGELPVMGVKPMLTRQ